MEDSCDILWSGVYVCVSCCLFLYVCSVLADCVIVMLPKGGFSVGPTCRAAHLKMSAHTGEGQHQNTKRMLQPQMT